MKYLISGIIYFAVLIASDWLIDSDENPDINGVFCFIMIIIFFALLFTFTYHDIQSVTIGE